VLTADAREAARRAVGEARASLGDTPPSFAVLFASAHFFGSAQDLVTAVADETGQIPLIGCVAEAVAGGAREVESGPAVALWLAAGLGPVETFGMEFVRTPTGGAYGGYRFGQRPAGVHLMICDPFTFPVADLRQLRRGARYFLAFRADLNPISEQLLAVHKIVGISIAVVAAMHIGAALYHHFVRKDRVLMRMISG